MREEVAVLRKRLERMQTENTHLVNEFHGLLTKLGIAQQRVEELERVLNERPYGPTFTATRQAYHEIKAELAAAKAPVKELERYNSELKNRLAELRQAAQRFIELEPEKDGEPNVDYYDMMADLRGVLYAEEDRGAQWGL